jgi:radical SAM protein with 4Fe4S-binding SPASM domain
MTMVSRKGDVFKLTSPGHNYMFNCKSGFFVRWGGAYDDNPEWGWPELADIEVTTKCANGCPFCYKGNTAEGKNMTLETFKRLFEKLPKTIRQIAFGADAHGTSNPDLIPILEYCRNNDINYVIPNITVADITDEMAEKLVGLCGAVAVSRYKNKNICYDSIKRLADRGLKQTNMHIMLSQQTYDWVLDTFRDIGTDERLKGLNATVLLSLKKKGRGASGFTPVCQESYSYLVRYALEHNVKIGFDSCGAPHFLRAVKGSPHYTSYEMMTEPCEGGLFSMYVDVDCNFFPCSFMSGEAGWKEGIPILEAEHFMRDVWHDPRTEEWREKLIANIDENKCRNCPAFEV